jgi:hypothetical protein
MTTIRPWAGLTVNGDLTLTAGDGDNQAYLGRLGLASRPDDPMSVSGNLLIHMGFGGNNVIVRPTPLTVGGRLAVTGNTFMFVGIQSDGAKGTIGGDAIFRWSLRNGESFRLTNMSVAGALRVVGGRYLQIRSVDVGRGTTISTGSASDSVAVDNCTFVGQFSLFTGAGRDIVYIAPDVGITRFDGAVNVRTGSEDDEILVGHFLPGGSIAIFNQTTRWDGGGGSDDRIVFDENNIEYNGGPPVLVGFE